MRITLGKYILEIDREKTRNYYSRERNISEGCVCDGCQNYELATEHFEEEVSQLFETLGVDIKKPTEVYVNYSKNNVLSYGGFYHICGEIMKGESPWVNASKTKDTMVNHLLDENMINISYNFKIAFQEECSLLSKSFPKPAIQMEIEAHIPWVLKKENTYEV